MNINLVSIKNFKSIGELQVSTDKSRLIKIFGRNGAGKTTFLEACMWCLFGKKILPDTCLVKTNSEGETFCTVEIEGYAITRTIKNGKEVLKIATQDGASVAQPQDFINNLIQPRCLDPMSLFNKNRSEQQEFLQEALDVKDAIESLQASYKEVFTERTEVNREVKSFYAQYSGIEIAEDLDLTEINVNEVFNELQRIQKKQNDFATMEKQVADLEAKLIADKERLQLLEEQKKALLISINSDTEQGEVLQQNLRQEASAIDWSLEETLKSKLSNAQTHNETISQNKNKIEQKNYFLSKYEEAKAKSDSLTEYLNNNKKEQGAVFASVKLDDLGLRYDNEEGRFLFNNAPLENMSTAERIKLGVQIALLGKNKLRILYVQDGSLLDDESMQFLQEIVEANDMQVWVEIVKSGSDLEVENVAIITSNATVETMQADASVETDTLI